MTWLNKIRVFFTKNWHYLAYFLLLIIAFGYFTFFQAVPGFPDPDSFYHTKMAMLIPEKGIIKAFPWLQATILKDNFIDQHFLYHVFLLPFTKIMDPVLGAKLAQVILAVGLTMFFYWFFCINAE